MKDCKYVLYESWSLRKNLSRKHKFGLFKVELWWATFSPCAMTLTYVI